MGMYGAVDGMGNTISAYFGECAEGDRLSFSQFCLFLSHYHVFGAGFDHSDAIEVYTANVGSNPDAALDPKTFKNALQAVAAHIWGLSKLKVQATTKRTSQAAIGSDMAARLQTLQDMLKQMALKSESSFDRETASEIKSRLYNIKVLAAAYEYRGPLKALFQYYAGPVDASDLRTVGPGLTELTAVTARSVCRMFRALKLVPDCVVAGELCEVAHDLWSSCRHLTVHERRFFDDERMAPRMEEAEVWHQPVRMALNGEPRYSFPDFVEVLVAVVLHTMPRLHFAEEEERVQRVHDILGALLALPRTTSKSDFNVQAYLREVAGGQAPLGRVGLHAEAKQDDLSAIFAELHAELPDLDPPKAPRFHKPPPGAVLRPPPMTKDELADKARKDGAKGAKEDKGKKKKKGKKKAGVEAGPKKVMVAASDFGKVFWYAKKPPRPKPIIQPELYWEKRADQLGLMEDTLEKQKQQAAAVSAPASGPVLRMTLIDEPLRAPPCPASEEVSTLIETALTSRRLRHYDTAVSLLIRARGLWAQIKARKPPERPWLEVQRLMPTPSPWGAGRWAMARTLLPAEVQPKQAPVPPSRPRPEEDRPTQATSSSGPRASRAAQELTLAIPEVRSSVAASESGTVQSARGRERESVARNTPREKRYDPKTDFREAAGDDSEHLDQLPTEASLFFLCELASLHSAMHEDDLAARLLWRARRHSEKLPASHPDTAVVWCGLGRVAFHTGHFEVAAKVTSKARVVREHTLGGDTIETATSYNNLACCFSALDRPFEAAAFLELAAEILKELAGEEHPRTLTAMRNLEKAKAAPHKTILEIPHIFSIYVKDRYKNKALGGKKKKKKGKRPTSAGASSKTSKSSKSSKSSKKGKSKKK